MSNQNIINSIPAPLPVDYDRQNSFTDYEIQNPGAPISGSQLDIEFNAVEAALDQTQARLRLIQRDDGALLNESVGLDQLKNEARIGVNAPTIWAAFESYQASDTVIIDQGQWYLCLVSHVASPVFADDLAAGRWRMLIDLTPYTTEARNWAIFPEDQLVPEGDGVDDYSALHHAAKALASEIAALSSQNAAASSASTATTQAGLAATARLAAETAQGLSESARDAALVAQGLSEAAQAGSEAALFDFKGRWFGGLANDPLVDLNGNPLNAGDAYFNTTVNQTRVYDGLTWGAAFDVVKATQAQAEAGTDDATYMTPLKSKLQIDAFRQELMDPYGATMLGNGAVSIDSVSVLIGLPADLRKSDLSYLLKSYHSTPAGPSSGGGVFLWDEAGDKADHNGGTVIDPDHSGVPFSPEWYAGGEAGSGVYRRVIDDTIFIEDFGAVDNANIDNEFAAAMRAADSTGLWIKSYPDRTYSITQGLTAGSIRLDFNNSTLITTAPVESLLIGNIGEAKLATSLASPYTPFTGLIKIFLNSVVGVEVGDVISIISNEIFHPNRENVYKRGITSTVAKVDVDGVHLMDEIPFSLAVSGSRVIVLEPSTSVVKNINIIGAVDSPGDTLSAVVVVGQNNCLLENITVDGFGNAGVKAYHSVGTRTKNITTRRSYYEGTNTSYGLAIYSCTRTQVSRLVTHTGRHGFVTGSNSSYLPGVAVGDDRGAPVFGLLIDDESSIFPELGTTPAAQGGHYGLDCHEGTYDITVRDSRFYKFQLGANFITFDNVRIFGNAGTYSLLFFIPENMQGAFLFKDVIFEGNGTIRFKGYYPHGGSGTYAGTMHIPSLIFKNCRAVTSGMFIQPNLVLGGNSCIIRSLILDGTHGLAVRNHDLSVVEIEHLQLANIKDKRRVHYNYTGSGSRIGIFEVNDCVWVGGYQALILDSALVANVNNLVFDGNEGAFTASIADDSRIYLNNCPLVLGSGSNGVNVVSRGGGGIIRRVASPIVLNSSSTLSNFILNEQVISN